MLVLWIMNTGME